MSETRDSTGTADVDVEDVQDVDVDAEGGRHILAALRSSWYVWAIAAVFAALTAIGEIYEGLSRSPFAEYLFGTIAAAFALYGLAVLAKHWRAVDAVQP